MYLIGRVLFFWMRGTETGVVAVDLDGVIHVVRGRNAVRRFQSLYDVGTVNWMRHAMLGRGSGDGPGRRAIAIDT